MNIGDVKFSEILSENENSLMHHGIEGQKWGERNGPPYPLNPSKRSWREKRAAKRREKILSDPNKLYKHSDEFTKEEIDEAITRYRSKSELKNYTKNKTKKLAINKKIMARNARSLWRNRKHFSDEELKRALDRLDVEHKVYDKKYSEISRVQKLTNLGQGALDNIASGLGSVIKISDIVTKSKHKKFDKNMTVGDNYNDYLHRQQRDYLMKQGGEKKK